MGEAPAAASHKHVGGISDEEEQEGTLFLYCAAQKECCTAPSCGAFGSCLGALYVLICDVLRSVPILAIVSYLVLGVGQGYFNTGLNSLVHLFDDMGVSAGAVTKYVDYYLTLVNLDALLVLLVSIVMSGVVREWFCHTLWVGKFTLPASWPTWCCCGVAGTTHSLDKIGSLCSCLGFPFLWFLIALAYVAWLVTFVLALVVIALEMVALVASAACDVSESSALLTILQEVDSSAFESTDMTVVCDYVDTMTMSTLDMLIGIAIIMVATVNFQIGIVDKYRFADREKAMMIQRGAFMEEVHALVAEQMGLEGELFDEHQREAMLRGKVGDLRKKLAVTEAPAASEAPVPAVDN